MNEAGMNRMSKHKKENRNGMDSRFDEDCTNTESRKGDFEREQNLFLKKMMRNRKKELENKFTNKFIYSRTFLFLDFFFLYIFYVDPILSFLPSLSSLLIAFDLLQSRILS